MILSTVHRCSPFLTDAQACKQLSAFLLLCYCYVSLMLLFEIYNVSCKAALGLVRG